MSKIPQGIAPKFPFHPDFNIAEFETLIQKKGLNLTWEKATLCPCVDADGKPHVICTSCKGQGWRYFDPQRITAIVTSLSAAKAFQDMGVAGDWVLGKASVTTSADCNLSFRDRLTSIDSQITFSELLFIDKNETLRYDAVELEYVGTKATTFAIGTDVTLVNGQLNWVVPKPSSGTAVTVRYITNPTWIVLDAIHEIRDTIYQSGRFIRGPRAHLVQLDYILNLEPQ